MGCGVFFTQLNAINGAINSLLSGGFGQNTSVMQDLNKMRGELLGRRAAGQALPRINVSIKTITGLSPGLLRIWYEIETGWFTEGREDPDGRPVYNHISDDEAIRLLREDPDVDLAHELMSRVPDIDN